MKLIRQPLADIPMAGIVKPGEELAGIGAVLVNDVHGNVVVAKLIAGGAASYCKPSDLFGEDRLKVPSPLFFTTQRTQRGATSTPGLDRNAPPQERSEKAALCVLSKRSDTPL